MASERPGAHPYMPNSVPGHQGGDAGRDRGAGASRSSSRRSRPTTACRRRSPAAGAAGRGRAEAPPRATCWPGTRPARRNLSFLGGGCWQHYVPAVCDEIVGRSEFLTTGLGHALLRPRPQPGLVRIREPARRAGRDGPGRPARLQLGLRRRPRDPHGVAPHRPPRGAGAARDRPRAARRSSATTASRPRCARHIDVVPVDYDPATGWRRPRRPRGQALDAHRRRLSREPDLPRRDRGRGGRDRRARPRRRAPRRSSASTRSRSACWRRRRDYGADIAVGTTQPLGVHMNCGGGVGGFIATRDEERYVREYRRCWSASPARRARASAASASPVRIRPPTACARQGKDWTGNSVYLWAIANAVYMALLGPAGLPRAGRADPAAQPLRRAARSARSPGVRVAVPDGLLQGVRRQLRRHRQDASRESTRRCASAASSAARTSRRDFPELGQSALYCVTEIHTQGRHRPARRRRSRRSSAMSEAPRATTPPSGTSRVIMELGHPGRRGLVFPQAEPEVARGRRRRGGPVPAGMRRATPPALPELSEPEVLRHYLHLSQETLGMMGISLFGTCTMKYNPRVSEALAARAELAELHPAPGRGDPAGRARDRPRLRPDPARALGHGPVRVPGRRRRRRRLHPSLRHPRLSRGARRARPARRDHHHDPGPPLQPGDRGGRRLQGGHADAGGERLPVARGAEGRRLATAPRR